MKSKPILAISAIAGVAFGIVVVSVLQSFLFSTGDDQIESKLSAAADQINKHCPMQIDKDTRLDNVASAGNKTIMYNYTILSNTDGWNNAAFESTMRSRLINYAKTIKTMKEFRDNKITLLYLHKLSDGRVFSEMTIRPDEYCY
jgi:hypothetical protein